MYFTVSSDAGGGAEVGEAADGEEGDGDGGGCGLFGGGAPGRRTIGVGGGGSALGRGDGRIEIDTHGCVEDDGGARLTVVSNDEMRNHRMALLEPVPFKR